MDPASLSVHIQAQGRNVGYEGRMQVRNAICNIVRQTLLERLARRQSSAGSRRQRLTKAQRRWIQWQVRILETVLYKKATSLDEYQDMSTLVSRVFEAGREVYFYAQQRRPER